MYKKGIQVVTDDIERYSSVGRVEDAALSTTQLASAHASVASLFMTSLCDEHRA